MLSFLTDLFKESKDRFVEDTFWSAFFLTILLMNWRIILILTSGLNYFEKIEQIEKTSICYFSFSILIGLFAALFRTFLWPKWSKEIEYYRFKIQERSNRTKSSFIQEGIIDWKAVIAAIEAFQKQQGQVREVAEQVSQMLLNAKYIEAQALLKALQSINEKLLPDFQERCQKLGVSHHEIESIAFILTEDSPTKETLPAFWKKMIKELRQRTGKSI